MANDLVQDAAKAQHLVVLVHGLWGNPVHLKHLRDTLATKREGEGLYLFCPKANSDAFTYDGIEVGAERITHEIERKIEELRAAGSKLSKISVAGYSLGGLVARYTVGLLYKNGVFDTLQPMNFTTFATPHLGVRTPRLGYRAQTWNFLGSRTLSTSGQQMFLVDDFRGSGRPLLAVLADPSSIFVRGLSQFKRKSVYANSLNDRSVPYYTSAMSRTDPFVDVDAIEVHPLSDQEAPVVLDPENPVTPRMHKEDKQLSFQERYIVSARTRQSLPFYAVLCTVLPLAVPLFLINAGYQTYKSAQRVRLHEAGGVIDLKRYRFPLLEEAQAMQDRVMERFAAERTHLNEESGKGYLPTPPPESAASSSSSSSVSDADESSKLMPSSVSVATQRKQQEKNTSPWPTLALTEDQFAMIDNLDKYVGFIKYPVHILKVQHTHAAIVVRMAKDSFKEGHAVSAHWAKCFEVAALGSAGKGRGIYHEPSVHLARYISTTLTYNRQHGPAPFPFEAAEEFDEGYLVRRFDQIRADHRLSVLDVCRVEHALWGHVMTPWEIRNGDGVVRRGLGKA
ncbi:hypothetical protein LTR91_002824 [Friedmanniomyces endolithicus]|uniref:DUF676 domain-containing protein n=1 Tax=Friedmanniomyces endolithicus TaxID=329885 RepID=A0AAN6QZF8_9PEZI|nr:hypothetical protein LTR73_000304 [Friedmanniomyces endolithicus]KAK0922496.1 hypothetical protein LTR57_007736 [Friedmanniomyces endolithicus]KAK0989646.1 hypothetical protein LTS01_008808 [Friedmanniomyces endolithicus]KAK1009683.1 hypothetical protein LTR91_002824 [Friedmanniomyces endolithicus]KAK1044155.1 hypothetical protein LTS16_007491 [Friedmanniomyces endolithicus]